jgi:hypothetical protein
LEFVIKREWLISSRPGSALSAAQMFDADRRYWGIDMSRVLLHLGLS